MPRSLPFSTSLTQANRIDRSWFIRTDIASPVGTKRWTDRAGGFTGNIDGTSQTWTEAGVIVGPLDQSDQDPLSVSWFSIWNLDQQWTTWHTSIGLRNTPVTIYRGWFDPATGALAGAVKFYDGKIDNGQLGEVAMLALKPFATPWAREVPWVTGRQLGAAGLIPKQSVTIQWGDAQIRIAQKPTYVVDGKIVFNAPWQ